MYSVVLVRMFPVETMDTITGLWPTSVREPTRRQTYASLKTQHAHVTNEWHTPPHSNA